MAEVITIPGCCAALIGWTLFKRFCCSYTAVLFGLRPGTLCGAKIGSSASLKSAGYWAVVESSSGAVHEDWQVFAFLGLLGCVLLWARTAQFGGPLLTMVTSMPAYLLQIYFHKYGAPAPDSFGHANGVADMAIHLQEVQRARAWLTGLGAGANLNDPVIHILMQPVAMDGSLGSLGLKI